MEGCYSEKKFMNKSGYFKCEIPASFVKMSLENKTLS
jgi:hypothetical protein